MSYDSASESVEPYMESIERTTNGPIEHHR
jgi:hypothetical protein